MQFHTPPSRNPEVPQEGACPTVWWNAAFKKLSCFTNAIRNGDCFSLAVYLSCVNVDVIFSLLHEITSPLPKVPQQGSSRGLQENAVCSPGSLWQWNTWDGSLFSARGSEAGRVSSETSSRRMVYWDKSSSEMGSCYRTTCKYTIQKITSDIHLKGVLLSSSEETSSVFICSACRGTVGDCGVLFCIDGTWMRFGRSSTVTLSQPYQDGSESHPCCVAVSLLMRASLILHIPAIPEHCQFVTVL